MAETERATSGSGKSFDVFEFREEDELTENAMRKAVTKFGCNNVLDHKDTLLGLGSGTGIRSNENGAVICGSVDAAEIDYNHDISGSFTPHEDEDFVKEKIAELNNFQHNDLNSHERATEIKSRIPESGNIFPAAECVSVPEATVWLDGRPDYAFPWSSCKDNSVHSASDADESMNERSPNAIDKNNVSPDVQPSNNCFRNWNLGDDTMGIVFYPDYIDYCGTHYLDAVVSFSQGSVVAKSKTVGRNERTFHIHLLIEDLVKIESQWNARCESGSVNIYFISKDVAEKDDIACDHSVSGIQELKFPAVDPDWYGKQEAIELLDVRYKALWNVLLDTGMEQFSSLPEVNAVMLPRSYFPNFDTPFEEVIYPKGDPDAVSISKRDVDLLLPETFVNDTIIDFYIKYLRTRQNAEDRSKCHFFNCFFFRKLADMDKDPSSAFDGNAAFLRVRKWTRKVNLLEKDFIFIPVNYNYHWSLIIICYFGKITHEDVADENSARVPCILHLDSLRGNHEGLKDLIQSYLWEEWKERLKETCEDLHSKFRNLKFATLELPQQQNTSDCGLFLLHYVELFLEEVPTNFNIYKISSSSKFLQADWFPPGEASMKRTHIERLISGLLDNEYEGYPPSDSDLQKTTHVYENEVGFSGTRLLRDQNLHSVCQVGQQMGNRCSKASGVFLNDLLDKGLATEPFNDAPWGDLEHRASFHEFKRSASLTQEEVVATESLQANLAAPALQHVDGGTPVFTYSPEDFRLHTVHQATLEEDADSPVTSDCDSETMLDFGESRGPNGDSFFFCQMQGARECLADSPPATDPADKLEVMECGSLYRLDISKDHPHTPCLEDSHLTSHQGDGVPLHVDHTSPLESSGEQHPAKRIRTSSPDVVEGIASNLAEDQ